jgi:integrase
MARRRYQKGSLALEGDRWVIRWREDELDDSGNITRRLRYRTIGTVQDYPTERLARREADNQMAAINASVAQPGRAVRLADFVVRWEASVLVNRKPAVQAQKRGHLKRYILPALGSLMLSRIGQEEVQGLVAQLTSTGRIKRHGIMNIIGTLSSILRTARKWGYSTGGFIRADLDLPTDTVPVVRRRFKPHEVEAIVDAAQGKARAMLATVALTGIRGGELMALQVENLDFETRSIRVTHTAWRGKLLSPKSAASADSVPMPEILAEVLLDYLETWQPNEAGLLFPNALGKPYNLTRFTCKKLWPILDRLGIARCGLHAFRRTVGTHMLASGASPKDVQRQLRHEDVKTTLRIYTEAIGDTQRKAAERVAGLLMSRKKEAGSVGAGRGMESGAL